VTIDLSSIDPGIRRLVALLRAHGFETTDSGDGVTKPADERALDIPHVFSVVADRHQLIAEADRLVAVLRAAGVEISGEQVCVSYEPGGPAILCLLYIDDAMLPRPS